MFAADNIKREYKKKNAVCSHVSSRLRHWIPSFATNNDAHAHTHASSEQPVHLSRAGKTKLQLEHSG